MRLKIVQGALLAAAMLVALPASAEKHKGKEEYWDGNCKVERKWKGNGDYKEERKCRAPRHVAVDAPPPPEPSIVISLPRIVIYPAAY